MITLVTIIHVVVCIFLILVILLQAGKGGGMGAAFGGAGAQTVFGGRGAQTFLGKLTTISAAIFMLTSLTLAYQASKSGSEIEHEEATVPAPSQPEFPGGAPPIQRPGEPGSPPAGTGGPPGQVPAPPAQSQPAHTTPAN